MATRGFLIRFIDIGLIVLFGFLMISDIEASSRVELAGGREPAEEEPDSEDLPVPVRVEVTADGAFVVVEPAEDGADAASGTAERRLRVYNVDGLFRALRTLSTAYGGEGRAVLIVIEPHPASAVQRTVDVMDVADRLGLAKSLRMDIQVAPPDTVAADSVAADSVAADSVAADSVVATLPPPGDAGP